MTDEFIRSLFGDPDMLRMGHLQRREDLIEDDATDERQEKAGNRCERKAENGRDGVDPRSSTKGREDSEGHAYHE